MTEPSETASLYAVLLGGRAARCHVELHDVVFAVGDGLESLHDQLLDAWFGQPEGLHVDAWARLDQVEGFRVHLERQAMPGPNRLWFINIGGYRNGEFGERHAYAFMAGTGKAEIKARAKASLLQGHELVHKDDLLAIDDCLRIDRVGPWHIRLEEDPQAQPAEIVNGYFPLPAATIARWQDAQAEKS